MSVFSKTLRRLREDKGLTQTELADTLGLTRSRINNYENGLREPDFETLELFADFFNIDMNGLISGSPSLSETEETLKVSTRFSTMHLTCLILAGIPKKIVPLSFMYENGLL